MSYSQNDEEAVILSLLGASARVPQRFLDIGAHDGVTFSNTRKLAEFGWGGTLVEPSPAAFAKLMCTYSGHKDIALVHAAVTARGPKHLMKFYDSCGDMLSTSSDEHKTLWEGRPGHKVAGPHVPVKVKFQPIFVAGISVSDLTTQFPGPYTVLNLDVEGLNFELFRELPLHDLGVSIACVEYQDKRKEIEQLAKEQGFRVASVNPENLILVSN